MDRHEAVTRSYQIPGMMWPTELCWLYDTFGKSRSHAEIGSFCGRSLFAACAGMSPKSRVYVVEPFLGYHDHVPSERWWRAVFAAAVAEITARVIHIESGSIESARQLHRSGVQLDSVFIDGDHNFAEVCADIESWKPLIRTGGIISGHDYSTQYPGVMDAVNQSFSGFRVVPNTRIWWSLV